jgi:hypothetical protein
VFFGFKEFAGMINKLFFAIILLNVFVSAAAAQLNPEQAILSAKDQFFDIKKRSLELERLKRDADKPPAKEDLSANFPQIKRDFEQIQKVNDNLFRLTNEKAPINYNAVLKFGSEINERALRLNSILFTTEPNAKKELKQKPETDESRDLKTLLQTLDKSLNSFVHNPMFQNLKLVNPTDLIKAQKDLENVIYVSHLIKVKTKELTKNDSYN